MQLYKVQRYIIWVKLRVCGKRDLVFVWIRWMCHKSRMGELKNTSKNLAGSWEGKRLIVN